LSSHVFLRFVHHFVIFLVFECVKKKKICGLGFVDLMAAATVLLS